MTDAGPGQWRYNENGRCATCGRRVWREVWFDRFLVVLALGSVLTVGFLVVLLIRWQLNLFIPWGFIPEGVAVAGMIGAGITDPERGKVKS